MIFHTAQYIKNYAIEYVLKVILLAICVIFSILIVPAYAQTTSDFGYQLHPDKLLENTEGILQIHVSSNDIMVPMKINNLKAISSDNSVIQILGIEDGEDEFTKNVLIKAHEPGITSIALAASGFSSKEISLEVFNNNNHPTQILMKLTPNEFSIDGPRKGFVALELATTGGLPTVAPNNIVINLETPNQDVIKLNNNQITISEGEYYAVTEFEIISSGDAIIFAETEGMKRISSMVKILEPEKPLQLKLDVFPSNFNSFSGSGVAIVQLLDASSQPVISNQDIHLELSVENPDSSINTSHDFEEIIFSNPKLIIKKGEYSAYTEFTPKPDLALFTGESSVTYEMFILAENVKTVGDSFTITHDEIGSLEGEGPSVTVPMPFLTTGKQEIIAVTYYETDIEVSRKTGGSSQGVTNRELVTVTVPVQAKEDHEISISSSELDTVIPINPTMKKGENVVIVFGDTGAIVPEESTTLYVTDNEGVKSVSANPIGPIEDDITMVVEPIIPMVMAESEFPIVAYLVETEEEDDETGSSSTDEEEDENPRMGVTSFIEDGILTFSANEFIQTESTNIEQNQPYAVMNFISNEVSTASLTSQFKGIEGKASITSHTTDPSEIHLAIPKNIIANSESLATIQLLDSVGNPVYAKKDTRIDLVSNNEDVLMLPQELIIKEGEYFSTFLVESFNEGEIELALLSEDFALSKFNIQVVDIKPVLSLDLIGTMNWNERIEAKLKVTIPQIQASLEGFEVEWITEGGEVMTTDEKTDSAGVAVLNILANDQEEIKITAKVSGNSLSEATISKTVEILNIPIIQDETAENVPISEESPIGIPLDITTILMIAIPVVIGGGIFFLKRTDRLEIITEKIPIGDKIEEIKEKISDIRER